MKLTDRCYTQLKHSKCCTETGVVFMLLCSVGYGSAWCTQKQGKYSTQEEGMQSATRIAFSAAMNGVEMSESQSLPIYSNVMHHVLRCFPTQTCTVYSMYVFGGDAHAIEMNMPSSVISLPLVCMWSWSTILENPYRNSYIAACSWGSVAHTLILYTILMPLRLSCCGIKPNVPFDSSVRGSCQNLLHSE